MRKRGDIHYRSCRRSGTEEDSAALRCYRRFPEIAHFHCTRTINPEISPTRREIQHKCTYLSERPWKLAAMPAVWATETAAVEGRGPVELPELRGGLNQG